jgi:hypothetical protein
MRSNQLLALAALALVPGCFHHRTYSENDHFEAGLSWEEQVDEYPAFTRHRRARVEEERPKLSLTDPEIAALLSSSQATAQERRRVARERLAADEPTDVAGVADALSALYAVGDRETAEALAARHAGVATWDHADALVRIECFYRRANGGALELRVWRRAGVEGPLAIAFPPGTYGVGEPLLEGDAKPDWTDPEDDKRYGHWPSVQDLAFLKAPVIVLPAENGVASVTVPIACASFSFGPPRADEVYSLHRFEAGSPTDLLLQTLCAANASPRPAEAQLAVWLARNDISWSEFAAQGGARGHILSFGPESAAVLPHAAPGAAALLLESGVDARRARFFAEADLTEAPAEPKPAEPESEPLPGLEPGETASP